MHMLCNLSMLQKPSERGRGGVVVEYTPPTSEAAGSNLGPVASCWKVGSYLPMQVVYSAVCTGFLHL